METNNNLKSWVQTENLKTKSIINIVREDGSIPLCKTGRNSSRLPAETQYWSDNLKYQKQKPKIQA